MFMIINFNSNPLTSCYILCGVNRYVFKIATLNWNFTDPTIGFANPKAT